jgi:hypothetical protein
MGTISAALVTDSTGDQVEIEDELLTLYTIPSDQATFDEQWYTAYDRINIYDRLLKLGSAMCEYDCVPDSYVYYEDGYGKFNGTATL